MNLKFALVRVSEPTDTRQINYQTSMGAQTDLTCLLLCHFGFILCGFHRTECAQKIPSKQKKRKRLPASEVEDVTDGESARITQRVTPPAMVTSMLPHTSPLRRSPRRTNNHSHNSSNLKQSALLSVQPLTSPGGATGRYSASAGKRRKFTSALSAAALREEDRVASGSTPQEQMLPVIPPYGNAKLMENGGASDVFAEGLAELPNSDLAKEIFGNSNANSSTTITKNADGLVSHEDDNFDFFLKSSPGTIMRSFNLASPQKVGQDVQDLGAQTILAPPPAFSFSLSPLRNPAASAISQGTSAVFSPLGSSLSTPFRTFMNAGKGRERATSEQPPASHSKLVEELNLLDQSAAGVEPGHDAHHKIIPSLTQFISSDDNLLGAGSNVQINLLPPTADRRLGGSLGPSKAQQTISDVAEGFLSDSVMNEFTTFYLDSSNNLFSPTPFNPKSDVSGKAALAPLTLQFENVKQQSLSPLTCLSSEMDVDLSNLPPSSPPPLPDSRGQNLSMHASSTSIANMRDFWSTFNSGLTATSNGHLGFGNLDDGQSPISVTTTITQGGTPQETLPVQEVVSASKLSNAAGYAHYSHTANDAMGGAQNPMMEYIQQTTFGESPLSLDTDGSIDPLFNYFPQFADSSMDTTGSHTHHRQSSTSSVSSAFLERLKGRPVNKAKSSSMGLSWSDSTGSSSSIVSIPTADLTARSRLSQQQKAEETNVPLGTSARGVLALESDTESFFNSVT